MNTSLAIQVLAQLSGFNRAWWVGYDTENRITNIDHASAGYKAKLKAFEDYGTIADGTPQSGEWDRWGDKKYERLMYANQPDPDEDIPEDSGLASCYQN